MNGDEPKESHHDETAPAGVNGLTIEYEDVKPNKVRGLGTKKRTPLEIGRFLSTLVLSIAAGAILVLVIDSSHEEHQIGQDIHDLYACSVIKNCSAIESGPPHQLEQLIGDLKAIDKDPNAPFSKENAQEALRIIDGLPGITDIQREHLKACVPPPTNDSRNKTIEPCLEDLERIRSLAASGGMNAALIAQAATELQQQRQAFYEFWLKAAQLILLNLLLPVLTALLGYTFGRNEAQSQGQ